MAMTQQDIALFVHFLSVDGECDWTIPFRQCPRTLQIELNGPVHDESGGLIAFTVSIHSHCRSKGENGRFTKHRRANTTPYPKPDGNTMPQYKYRVHGEHDMKTYLALIPKLYVNIIHIVITRHQHCRRINNRTRRWFPARCSSRIHGWRRSGNCKYIKSEQYITVQVNQVHGESTSEEHRK